MTNKFMKTIKKATKSIASDLSKHSEEYLTKGQHKDYAQVRYIK